MPISNHSRRRSAAFQVVVVAALFAAMEAAPCWAATPITVGEAKCHAALVKGIGRHAAALTKAVAACKDAELRGEASGPCPDAEAIEKSATAVASAIAGRCASSCALSGLPCIANSTCPPNGLTSELCSAGGKNPFDLGRMGFPGAFCESLVGGRMTDPEDFGTCAVDLASVISAEWIDNVYGELTDTPALSAEARSCLAGIAKLTPKSAAKIAKTVGKCRDKQLRADPPAVLPDLCATDDPKTSDKIAKLVAKYSKTIAGKCTDEAILELDLCGNGRGGTADVAAAQACLSQALIESSSSIDDGDTRPYAAISIVNAAYPATTAARCGDGIVNQLPSQFLLIGEECDGGDDSACPGECLPPGDLFECTCGNIPRSRGVSIGGLVDLDTGWSGNSHNSTAPSGAGSIANLTNCDCSEFGHDDVTSHDCVGTSVDHVCDTYAELRPRCARRVGDGTSCDEVGDEDGNHTSADCVACDQFAANAGDFCSGEARYCLGGASDGSRCNQPSDCPGGSCAASGVCLDGPFGGNGCGGPQDCGICVGGTNGGGRCSIPSNCPGGSCETHQCASDECLGGANEGNPCTSDAQCTGGRCAETTDCASQCYDEAGAPQGPCWRQSDCAAGERCRGRCDTSDYCLYRYNGAPLPLSAAGVSTCVWSRFWSDAVGTRDLLTGENASNIELRSLVYLANELNSRPCPVCGGFCDTDSAALSGVICEGSCTGPETACRFGANTGSACVDNADCGGSRCDAVACRFDEDCPSGTCDGAASPECAGGTCVLDLICKGGNNDGNACRIESATRFGTTSADCSPIGQPNLSGTGLQISWSPLSSEASTIGHLSPCTASGYENYDCNCVLGGGLTKNRPNSCRAACNDPDPAYFARPCSRFTQCVGGTENGASCDEDSDCDGGTCSGQPGSCGVGSTGTCTVRRCSGGPSAGARCFIDDQCPASDCDAGSCTVGDPLACDSGSDGACVAADCNTNGDCDGGAACEDTCPAGRCVPLCALRGSCDGGERDGFACVVDSDCAAGGTCVFDDDEEGACASGSTYHCDGPGREFIGCRIQDLGTRTNCEFGADGIEGNSDDFPGAGTCVTDLQSCFVNDGLAEGGDTGNGEGSPSYSPQVATYCIPSVSSTVDGSAGLPGPGRIRTVSRYFVNVPSIP